MEIKLRSKASECNINQYIACAFEHDLTVLIISGEPTPQQLFKAFENILTEYYDLSGLSLDVEENELLRRIKYLECRKKQIDTAIYLQEQALSHFKHPVAEFFDLFHCNNYNPVWNNDIKDFRKQLQCIQAEENTYFSETEDLQKEIDHLRSKPEIKQAVSEKNFYGMIDSIEAVFKIKIDFEQYNMKRFAYLVARYIETVERNNSKN